MILLDSSFLIALKNEGDAHHKAAVNAMKRISGGEWGSALVAEYVFLEVVTVLAARRGLPVAIEAGRALLDADEVDFLPCSDFFAEGFATFQAQRSGSLSFVDATLVAVARERKIDHIATFDADFRGIPGLTVVP